MAPFLFSTRGRRQPATEQTPNSQAGTKNSQAGTTRFPSRDDAFPNQGQSFHPPPRLTRKRRRGFNHCGGESSLRAPRRTPARASLRDSASPSGDILEARRLGKSTTAHNALPSQTRLGSPYTCPKRAFAPSVEPHLRLPKSSFARSVVPPKRLVPAALSQPSSRVVSTRGAVTAPERKWRKGVSTRLARSEPEVLLARVLHPLTTLKRLAKHHVLPHVDDSA